MAIDMSQHFGFLKLARFTLPTIGMMIVMTSYSIVDGFFVSNYCGSTALAAVNFTYPIPLILGTIGFMLGTGGSAIVAKTRGEGDDALASRQFSFLVYVAAFFGIVFSVVGFFVLEPVLVALGATGELLELSLAYGRIIMIAIPFEILQYFFQELMVTAGKPGFGFGVTVAAGLTNVVLDFLLIVVFDMGLTGAAIGTFSGMVVGALVPLAYFAFTKKGVLKLGATTVDFKLLGHAALNGSSEMVSNIAMSVVTMSYNVQLLNYIGEDGVAAFSVIGYVSMVFGAVFMGYIFGSSPLMSYQYGAKNRTEMQSLFKKSIIVVIIGGLVMFGATRIFGAPLAQMFVGYDESLLALTIHAFMIYSVAFIIMGVNMYGSALFTALGNGKISAIISFFRTFICEVGAVFLIPLILGADGIWWAITFAESVALVLVIFFMFKLNPRYGYMQIKGDS